MSSMQSELSIPRNVKVWALVSFIYIMVFVIFALIIPDSDLPVNTEPIFLSWVLIILMPVEIFLIYSSYRFFIKRTDQHNLMGPAILMYIFSITPALYGFLIRILDSTLRTLAVPLGLTFSLVGYGLTTMLLPSLNESIHQSKQVG